MYPLSPNGEKGQGEGEVISNEKKDVDELMNRCPKPLTPGDGLR
jgi:hypothetical protein